MLCPVGSVCPLSRKWPPPEPVFHSEYWVIGSPNGSAETVNRLDAVKVWLWVAAMLACGRLTDGPLSPGAVTVRAGDHALVTVPSETCSHSMSLPPPLW